MAEPSPSAPLRVTGLDHIVLTVPDIEACVAWYRDELGLETMKLDEWRAGTALFPSLRINATTIIDLLPGEPGGENLNHFAVVVEDVDVDELAASGRFTVESGPSDLSGARGTGRGIYVRDPGGVLVELRSYP